MKEDKNALLIWAEEQRKEIQLCSPIKPGKNGRIEWIKVLEKMLTQKNYPSKVKEKYFVHEQNLTESVAHGTALQKKKS